MGASGPSSRAIANADRTMLGQMPISVVSIDEATTVRLTARASRPSLAEMIGDSLGPPVVFGRGDTVAVTIWEAPPALLFGSSTSLGGGAPAGAGGGGSTAQSTNLPEIMVDDNGRIIVPFAGSIIVAGRTPTDVERIITARLTGKAHQPQVIVRRVGNATSDITVMGEVGSNTRVPLTPKGERLLDAIAAAGGVRQQSSKTLIQVTRGDRVAATPLDLILREPLQNIRLQPSDVVTAIYQPFSFTSMGATGASNEVPFEAVGISLAQAMGRVSGLREDRASAKGVFVFRFEDPSDLAQSIVPGSPRTKDGRVPVIYRLDLSDPRSIFTAQRFPMKDKDIVYVTSAPASDLQRFISMVSSVAFTVIGLGQTVQ